MSMEEADVIQKWGTFAVRIEGLGWTVQESCDGLFVLYDKNVKRVVHEGFNTLNDALMFVAGYMYAEAIASEKKKANKRKKG